MGIDYPYPLYMPVSDDFLAGLQLGYALSEYDYSLRVAAEGLRTYGVECLFNVVEHAYSPRSFYESVSDHVGQVVMDINGTEYRITSSTKNILVKQ